MKESERASKDSGEGEFIRLFLKHEPVLRAYARTILPDWNSVEDALQEASVTMWEKIAQLDDADGFLPWAKVILKYKCLQAITRLRRERPVLSDAVLHLLSEEADSLVENKYSQMRLALNTCMAQIPASQQELLLAPYGGTVRIQQIAKESGKTTNSLYKLLGRLREKLAICVQQRLKAEDERST